MTNDTPKAGDVYRILGTNELLVHVEESVEVCGLLEIYSINEAGLQMSFDEDELTTKIGINGKFDPNGEPKITFDKVEG